METREVCYDSKKKLNCYVVSTDIVKHPHTIVVIVHGGAWMIGSKDSFHAMAKQICHEFGVTCIVPDYSLSNIDCSTLVKSKMSLFLVVAQVIFILFCKRSKQRVVILTFLLLFLLLFIVCIIVEWTLFSWRSKNSHPTHVRDVAQCIRFVTTSFQTQTSKIVLIGHSAGAHMCSLLALNDMYLEKKLFDQISGVVAISGVYSYWDMRRSFASIFLNKYIFVDMFTEDLNQETLDAKKNSDPAQWLYITSAWPLFHVNDLVRKTRFLLLTSDTDFSILKHSVNFERALKQHNFPVQHIHVPNTTHFSIHKEWYAKHSHVFDYVAQFLHQTI